MPTARRKHARPPLEIAIPEKLYFRIGEVSELAQLPTYVLRYWESEFAQLKPTKSSTGQRMYRRKDVECVMQIRRLLYEEGFTIAGARERLREEQRAPRPLPAPVLLPVPVAPTPPPAVAESAALQPQLPLFAQEAAAAQSTASQSVLRRVRSELSELLALLR
jgi:DNA-binding transcriptional MerR regulator